jgi:hypothetical protein
MAMLNNQRVMVIFHTILWLVLHENGDFTMISMVIPCHGKNVTMSPRPLPRNGLLEGFTGLKTHMNNKSTYLCLA